MTQQPYRTRFAGLIDFLGDINRGWDRVHGINPRNTRPHRVGGAHTAGRARRGR